MNEQRAVSIITICRNNPTELRSTLDSFDGLDFSLCEIIVIDGSDDDSCSNIMAATSIDCIYHHERDRGKYDAMNKGLNLARGDGILFINSGDRLFDSKRFNQIIADRRSIFHDHIIFGDHVLDIGGHLLLQQWPHVTADNMRCGNLPCHQATIIPRTFYLSHNYDIDMHIAADTKLMRAAYETLPHIALNEPIAVFAHGGISSMPGTWHSVLLHFREMTIARNLDKRERQILLGRLIARKLLSTILTRRGLFRLQTFMAIYRTDASRRLF